MQSKLETESEPKSSQKTYPRLILISNGEPYAHKKLGEEIKQIKLAGGLTTGLDPLMQKDKGIWIAWGRGEADFQVTNGKNKVKVPDKDGYTLKRVHLSEEEIRGFYYGFSNEILWPICHSFNDKADFNPDYWQYYYQVNQKYARTALEEIQDNDFIWIHDYHLTLTPRLIREQKKEAQIAMFWHIPWPSWDSFRIVPWKREILTHMLASDFIAFHTDYQANNFLECANMLGARIDWDNQLITYDNHQTKVAAIPLGVDYNYFHGSTLNKDIDERAREIKRVYHAENIILGVDRLDYTKGILERLQAIDLLFSKYPQYIRKVTLIQRVSPSRNGVEEYQLMREKINRTIGDINGRYQMDGWTPIKYFHQSLEQEGLLPYYRAADIGLITPLIDGMNLVAKEYIAAQDEGVLILSEFAGAADQLGDAIMVNPYHVEKVAETLHQALEMSDQEKSLLMSLLKDKVKRYDLNWWRDKFLQEWQNCYE